MALLRYRRKPDRLVTAVQLKLDTGGLPYRKWGAQQLAKSGDWLVDNGEEVYTIDADVFARTYAEVTPGRFAKTTPVWVERATAAGVVTTHEGTTHYAAGDYLISNDPDGHDRWAVSAAELERLYEPDA